MLSLYLLAVVGLVVVAATDPHDFSRLCSSPAPGGECPAGWRNVGGDCVKFMSGWDQAKVQEVCREEGAEYEEYLLMSEYSEYLLMSGFSDFAAKHLLPVCLVRRETQCKCGRTNRISIVGGNDVEKNEYPWQGNNSFSWITDQRLLFLIFSSPLYSPLQIRGNVRRIHHQQRQDTHSRSLH